MSEGRRPADGARRSDLSGGGARAAGAGLGGAAAADGRGTGAPGGPGAGAPGGPGAGAPADGGHGPLGPADIHVHLPSAATRPDQEDEAPFGQPGQPVNRAHPFFIGFMGALGVLTAYVLLTLLGRLSNVLTIIAVALFLSLGLEPVVAFFQRRGLPRGLAVAAVFVAVIAAVVGFAWAVVPTVVTQAGELTQNLPQLVEEVENSALVQRLDREYGIVDNLSTQLQERLANGETVLQLFGGVFGAGLAVVSGAFSTLTVLVLMLYFTASLRVTTEAAYRLVPASRRPRVQLLGDEIIRRIGGYILGQVAVATINGVCTYVLLNVLRLPYALVLSIAVGILGLIPLVGATLGAVIVISVALFHSWQYAVVVAVYYIVYQQIENYLIAPKIMQRTVAVPGFVTVIAALAGGTLMGVIGALIAIPVAAGILLIIQEVLVPRQERH